MKKNSFVLVGSGALLNSAVKKIKENNGDIKSIYVDNPTDTKRYINSFQTIEVSRIDKDFNYLKAGVDQSTWLLSIENKKILSTKILSLFRDKALNFHPGILPYYKGLYCYQWAVLNGEKKFAVTIHHMEEEVDAGPIVIEKFFPIEEKDTGLSVYQKSIKYGKLAIDEVLSKIFNKVDLKKIPQKYQSTIAFSKANPYHMEVDWQKSPDHIINGLRASSFHPLKPPAFQFCFNGNPVIKGEKLEIGTDEIPGTILGCDGKKLEVAAKDNSVIKIHLS